MIHGANRLRKILFIGGGNETKMMNNEIGGFIFEKIVFINEFSMKLWRIVIG